jgi:beta-N-acetylhexosaminidase
VRADRGWDIGNWNRHEFFRIRTLRQWDLNARYEEKFLATGSRFDSINSANNRDLLEHLLTGLAFGAENSALRHPVVLTELYKRAQADPQGCKVVISRETANGKINGSLILYHSQSQLDKYFPTDDQQTGGIAGIVVSKHAQAVPIVQGLVTKTASILKAMGLSSVQIFVVSISTSLMTY